MLRTVILEMTLLFFSAGSMVAVEQEDWGHQMHGITEETNASDHKGKSYISLVTNTGRLITQKMMHICSIPVTMEQYLCDWIRKAARWLEDIFMQAATLEQIRMPNYTQQVTKHRSHIGKNHWTEKERKGTLFSPSDKMMRLAMHQASP